MGRPPRRFVSGYPVHLVQRGNNRAPCFFGPGDQSLYLSLLARIAGETGCLVHAYVLMTNHVHVLATPPDDQGIPSLMQRLSQRYTLAINRKYERSGAFWQGRYGAFCVDDDDYVIACHAYIELNPVRAGMVSDPLAYRWSSHAANIGQESRGFLSIHPTIAALGPSLESAQDAYRRCVQRGVDDLTLAAFRDGALPREGCQARA